jgi:hypothetical protein
MTKPHFLVVSLPAQGHLNPTLQFAKNLAATGTPVTFATTNAGLRRIPSLLSVPGITYTSFSDGHDDGTTRFVGYLEDLKRIGTQTLTELIQSLADEGRHVSYLVYTVLLQWVGDVARDLRLPSAFLAIQSATTFAVYYRFFNSFDNFNFEHSGSVNIPGLPPFTENDIPSFLLSKDEYFSVMVPAFKEHIGNLEKDSNSCVLVNTFDALEADSIKVIGDSKIKMISIGPLVPSFFCDGRDPQDTAFGCDLVTQSSREYIQWLDQEPENSVIYVSFGSLAVLKKNQKEEVLQGLVSSGRRFFWVDRECSDNQDSKDAEPNGLIVPWCSQMEVLCHRSIGCFLTHCGWNSTMESIVAGVPMVGFPQFSDQVTNAKMVDEVWKNGIRVAAMDKDEVVTRAEIRRCLDIVMASSEMRLQAANLKNSAIEAVKGGSSYTNLKNFLNNIIDI